MYRVNLEIFAGPMDLLLYLVRKDEVDIYDIEITRITDQYIQYIDLLKNLDIDLAGDFLVTAATLMQMKSAMLLPKADPGIVDDEEFDDPRSELIRQLLEYKKFKDAANLLKEAVNEQQEKYPRPNTLIENLKTEPEPEIDMDHVSVWDLLEAFDNIMQATGSNFDISHISDDTPIDLYQIEILHRLQSEGAMTFERIFEGKQTRSAMIGLFLALLELVRDELVWAEQDEKSKAIFLKSLTDKEAEIAVHQAIMAAEGCDEQEQTAAPQEPGAAIKEIHIEPHDHAVPLTATNDYNKIPIRELPAEKKQQAQSCEPDRQSDQKQS